jgi:hypothetical protein
VLEVEMLADYCRVISMFNEVCASDVAEEIGESDATDGDSQSQFPLQPNSMLGPCESLLPYAVDFLLSGV